MSKLKITKGKFSITQIHEPLYYRQISVNSYNPHTTNTKNVCNVYGHNDENIRMNAELIADAFNVANETNKLPSELREERDELKKRMQSLVLSMSAHPDCTEGSEFDDLSSLAQELINKIENNE